MPPQLQTHDGSDQVHDHGDEQKDDGGGLAGLCSAEGSVDTIVENRVGAEAPAGGIANINDACCIKGKVKPLKSKILKALWSKLNLEQQRKRCGCRYLLPCRGWPVRG